MELTELQRAVANDAVWVAFLNVLLQQLGLPVPAVPTLLVIGSLAGVPSALLQVLAAAILASVLADAIWYAAGRAFGYRILSSLCRLSINPGTCVTQTEHRFVRWGVWSLVFAKFIPGFSTVAPPIAGSLKMPLGSFLAASGIGAGLWAGIALAVGWALRSELLVVLRFLDGNGLGLAALVLAIFGGWILWKFWQKYRFEKLAAIPRISPEELLVLMRSPTPPLLLDLRGGVVNGVQAPVQGALVARMERLEDAVAHWPKESRIVTLCACPEDASAVMAARKIMGLGYLSVTPLRGGFEALEKLKQMAPPA